MFGLKKVNFLFILIILLFSCNFYANNINNNLEKADYLYYQTVGEYDLYIDTYENIFTFDNGERKILIEPSYHSEYSLNEININCKKDKYGNLYVLYYKNDDILAKVDKNLDVYILSEHNVNGFDVFDGVLFYCDDKNVIKYDNDIKDIMYQTNGKFLDRIDKNKIMVSGRNGSNDEIYFEYKNGIFNQVNLNIKYFDLNKHINKKIETIEKIENYNKNFIEEEDEANFINEDNSFDDENELLDQYLYIDDEGKVSYYYQGKEVVDTLVFVEGNIKTNKSPLCFADTYAYYFGQNGKAMSSGKITPIDKNYFQTDSAFRILKSCDFVYDNIIKRDKFELYNDYFLMGKYEQDDISYNGNEDLKWIVIADNGKEVLLLSKYIIDYKNIDKDFLDKFYNESFTDDEKSKILDKENLGKIFLIDEKTLKNVDDNYKKLAAKNNSFISAIGTNYVINKGIERETENNQYYQHTSYLIKDNKIVKPNGDIIYSLDNDIKFGFRPAMWVVKD